MVCIPKMPSWWNSEEDSEQLEELEYVFSSDTSVYYRNWMTRLMDEHFGDVQSDVTDMENWARMQIQNVVASYSVQLLDAVKIAAQLDWFVIIPFL